MPADLVQYAGQSLLSESDFELLSLDLRPNQRVFVHIRDALLVVVLFLDAAHHLDLSLVVRLDHAELLVVVLEQAVRSLAELEHGEEDDEDLQDECFDGQDVELVAPANLGKNDGVGYENKAVAEDEAEVGGQAQEVEEALVVVELGLGRL